MFPKATMQIKYKRYIFVSAGATKTLIEKYIKRNYDIDVVCELDDETRTATLIGAPQDITFLSLKDIYHDLDRCLYYVSSTVQLEVSQ